MLVSPLPGAGQRQAALVLLFLVGALLALIPTQTQAFLFPTAAPTGSSKRRPAGGVAARSTLIPLAPPSPLFSASSPQEETSSSSSSSSSSSLSPDEEIMEALIAMKWEDLEAFSNQHYKYLIHPQVHNLSPSLHPPT